MRSYGHNITIAFLLRRKLRWARHLLTLFGICFVELVNKNLLPTNKKVKRKDPIPEYYAPSAKGYDEKNTRSIDKKNILT